MDILLARNMPNTGMTGKKNKTDPAQTEITL